MRVIRRIDRGGFGFVDEVIDDRGQHLARKSFDPQGLPAQDHEKLQRRFAREVRIQSQIRHPNIMPIIEHDLEVQPPWFTMPLATESFLSKIERDRAQGTFDTNPWQDILAAAEELHRLGYVHRDLKPANILLVDAVWVLSDFGLVLPTARETTVLTSSRSAYGSHYYAAPEQAQDFRNTPEQADIFALGCILHDAVAPDPSRIPFAQIRVDGPYGPVLEKCTEVEVRRRIPSIAALRAALFELWTTSQFPPASRDDVNFLEAVLANPDSAEAWRALLGHLENAGAAAANSLLRAIDAQMMVRLSGVDEVLFSRLINVVCAWAESSGFDWAYCDVVGDRLLEAYRVGSTRIRSQIVLAALELAVSHNRWHVMKQVGAMLGAAADNGLVDRILIEMAMEPGIERKLRRVEQVVYWARDRWHAKIADFLNQRDIDRSVTREA